MCDGFGKIGGGKHLWDLTLVNPPGKSGNEYSGKEILAEKYKILKVLILFGDFHPSFEEIGY